MKLFISDVTKGDIDSGFSIDAASLSLPGAHLFIASHRWESIHIADVNAIPSGVKLSVFRTVADRVLVTPPETLNERAVHVLTALYPELSGKIRKCFVLKGDIKEVLAGCLV